MDERRMCASAIGHSSADVKCQLLLLLLTPCQQQLLLQKHTSISATV
jgi:hypothetical protein